MKALIAKNELIHIDGEVVGCRVAQVAEKTFPVHQDLVWVDCNDEVVSDLWYYSDGKFYKTPEIVIPAPTLDQLQEQLKHLTNQIAALANTGK